MDVNALARGLRETRASSRSGRLVRSAVAISGRDGSHVAAAEVSRHGLLELIPRLPVLAEIAVGIGVVGAAPALGRLVMAQKSGRIPATGTKLVASPLHGLVPLLCEVGGVGGMSQLDADSGVVAVADMPAKSVLGHRVVNGGAVQLHDVMHGVGVIARPQQSVVVCARARVCRLVDYEIRRIEVSVAVRYVLVDALVCLRAARGGEGRHKGEDDGKGAAEPYPAPTYIVFGICHLTSLVE